MCNINMYLSSQLWGVMHHKVTNCVFFYFFLKMHLYDGFLCVESIYNTEFFFIQHTCSYGVIDAPEFCYAGDLGGETIIWRVRLTAREIEIFNFRVYRGNTIVYRGNKIAKHASGGNGK